MCMAMAVCVMKGTLRGGRWNKMAEVVMTGTSESIG